MSRKVVENKEENDMAIMAAEYNEKIFLAELEASLKEMQEIKFSKNDNSEQSSWRDLFNTEEEQVINCTK